jgi:hypothetical protein
MQKASRMADLQAKDVGSEERLGLVQRGELLAGRRCKEVCCLHCVGAGGFGSQRPAIAPLAPLAGRRHDTLAQL